MKLLIATRNRHKLQEIRSLLNLEGIELVAASDIEGLPDVVEDRESFEGNAAKKARELSDAAGLWTVADDSGLEVDALGGAPGVHSARFAGEHGDDAANNRKLLAELEGRENRGAQFRCAVALAAPDGRIWTTEGICRGRVETLPRGENGFGYDPLFTPDGFSETFAEMAAADKNRISHRARAFEAARLAWRAQLAEIAGSAGREADEGSSAGGGAGRRLARASKLMGLAMMLVMLLCGGCETEVTGKTGSTEWQLHSNPHRADEPERPGVSVAYTNRNHAIRVTP